MTNTRDAQLDVEAFPTIPPLVGFGALTWFGICFSSQLDLAVRTALYSQILAVGLTMLRGNRSEQ